MSNQPYAKTRSRVIEYAEPLRTWKHYATIPEDFDETEAYNTVQRCRGVHSSAEVRLVETTEYRYAGPPKP